MGIVAFKIRCSSSEFSVAESSSGFGPARGTANDRVVPVGSSQSRTWIREVGICLIVRYQTTHVLVLRVKCSGLSHFEVLNC